MSRRIVDRVLEEVSESLVDACWAQWGSLTGVAVDRKDSPARTIVDPEALLLGSLAAGHVERRLYDLVASWASEASSLMSLQRMRSVSEYFPSQVTNRIAVFTSTAVESGDRRWRAWDAGCTDLDVILRGKRFGPARLLEAPALTLRLRAGFGVNAKADLLSFLLGSGGAACHLGRIAAATLYTDRALRTAAQDMARAGFIHEEPGRPASYRADPEAWAGILSGHHRGGRESREATEPAEWRSWISIFSFHAALLDWAGTAARSGWTDYVAASRARDLVEAHRQRLREARFPVPSLSEFDRGPDFLHLVDDMTNTLIPWTRQALAGR